MSFATARETVIQRVRKELIGPGSDIFLAGDEFREEIIEGKPLTRYFSGILFPRKKSVLLDETGENEFSKEDEDLYSVSESESNRSAQEEKEEDNEITGKREGDEENTAKVLANQYFPSIVGLTCCLPNHVRTISLNICFGTYSKADYNALKLKYNGPDTDSIERYGV